MKNRKLSDDLINSLRRWGPSTTPQLAERLRLTVNSVSTALWRLHKQGKVKNKTVKGNRKIWNI